MVLVAPLRRIGAALLGVALAIATGGCAGILFYPERILIRTPDQVGVAYRDVDFQSGDGTPLHGWLLPTTGPPKGTVVFFHGNAENISTHLGSVYWLPDFGYQAFLFDYRGFGRSGGDIDLDGIHEDALAALEKALALPEVDPGRVVVFGQSIGAPLAVAAVAAGDPARVRAVVLESGFASYRRITREKLGDVPLTWPFQWPLSLLMTERYSAGQWIGRLSPTPVLVIHGDRDNIVPLHHGEELFAAAGEPKRMWRIEGGGHIEAFARLGPVYRERLIQYLDQLLGPLPVAEPLPAPAPSP